MARERFLRTLRALAECYQAFERYSDRDVRALGLTPAQFDIIATLGNTPGMSFRELGRRTLITKGTLTGVVDRLEARGLVRRVPSVSDGRSTVVMLSDRGAAEFDRVFPHHIAHLKRVFGRLSIRHLDALERDLGRLAALLAAAGAGRDDLE